jgi:hypothetical protein
VDHRAKLSWAGKHLDVLETSVKAWQDLNPRFGRVRKDSQSGKWVAVTGWQHNPPLSDWSLIVGDTVHSLRSALDALVHALSARRIRDDCSPALPESLIRKIQFPICDDAAGFAGQRYRLRHVHPEVLAAIEALQPYYGAPDPRTVSMIWVLGKLANIDKHRRVMLATLWTTRSGFLFFPRVTGKGGEVLHEERMPPVGFQSLSGPFKDGDIVASWPDTPEAVDFRVQDFLRFSTEIRINEGPPPFWLSVGKGVRRMHDHVKDTVFPSLEKFL